jgi:hypothetical protein
LLSLLHAAFLTVVELLLVVLEWALAVADFLVAVVF